MEFSKSRQDAYPPENAEPGATAEDRKGVE